MSDPRYQPPSPSPFLEPRSYSEAPPPHHLPTIGALQETATEAKTEGRKPQWDTKRGGGGRGGCGVGVLDLAF